MYDLSPVNEFGHPIGLGVFHSGLEVDGREYTFAGGGGIFDHDPRKGAWQQGNKKRHLQYLERECLIRTRRYSSGGYGLRQAF